MNILQEVSREHSKAMCNRVVKYVGGNPRRFNELVQIFLGGPYRVTQRSGWPLSCCVELHPELIKPHLRTVIRNLDKPGLHDSVKRNTVRLLQFIEIPRNWQGPVVALCFKFLNDVGEAIAVRVFSMTVLGNLALHQPELGRELKLIIEDFLPYASAGFRSRATRILKRLNN